MSITTGIEIAATFIAKRAADYLRENATTEWDTGALAFRFGEAGRDYYCQLDELAEDIRALKPVHAAADMSAADHKKLTLAALHQMLGDDLYRARNAFRGMSPEQMAQQHGQSGRTRAAILSDYEQHDAKVKAAIAWVEGLQ